jgi:hypothetical protein
VSTEQLKKAISLFNKTIKIPFILTCTILFCGCLQNYTTEKNNDENKGIIQASELYKETEPNGSGDVTTRFYTNETKYRSLDGCTLWTDWGDEEITDTFIERTVTTSKVKGNNRAGYGMLICRGLRETDNGPETTMLAILINNSGEYAIGKVIGAKYENLVWWTANSAIRSGLGAPNEIKVWKDNEYFVLEANRFELARFIDGEEPKHSGGRNGYAVVISSLDRLPKDAVDVYFTEQK